MTHRKAVLCLLLSLSAAIFDAADASPLMSVHGDAAGRRQRTSTSWAPPSTPSSSSFSIGDEAAFELFNPMVRSKVKRCSLPSIIVAVTNPIRSSYFCVHVLRLTVSQMAWVGFFPLNHVGPL